MVKQENALAVLAHPYSLEYEKPALVNLLKSWADLGLSGIEVYYPEHSPRQQQLYKNLANRFDLVETGGSDFHGPNVNGTEIGTGRGSLAVPDQLLQQLKERRAGKV